MQVIVLLEPGVQGCFIRNRVVGVRASALVRPTRSTPDWRRSQRGSDKLLVILPRVAVIGVETRTRGTRQIPLRPLRRGGRRSRIGAAAGSGRICWPCRSTTRRGRTLGEARARLPVTKEPPPPRPGYFRAYIAIGGQVTAKLHAAVHVAGALRFELEHEVRSVAALPDQVDGAGRVFVRWSACT